MTDTPVTEAAPVVETVEVTETTTVKPYDMLDEYEADEPAEAEAPKAEVPPEPENPEPEAPKPSTKDDKIIDGVEELPIKRLINGKEVEFKIKDAIDSHVKQQEFNRNMDRRVQEISRREKTWQGQQSEFKGKVSEVINAAKSGDFVTGIKTLAKIAKGSSDLDVTHFEKLYFDQLEKVRDVYTNMTPEQQKAYFAERSAAEAREEAAKLRGEKTSREAQSALQEEVNSLQEQHGLSQEEFWGNYKALVDSQVGEGKQFKDPNEISASDVVSFSLAVKHEVKVLQAGQIAGVTDEAILDEVSRITATSPDLTVEDVVKVIKNAGIASPSTVENLNRKAQKSGLNSSVSSAKKQDANGMDDEDLDFLYRKQPKVYSKAFR